MDGLLLYERPGCMNQFVVRQVHISGILLDII